MKLPFFSVGHSSRTIEDFVQLLRFAEVETVADIRSFPNSRSNPQFNRDVLPDRLAAFRLAYVHIPELGGRRGRSRNVPPEANGLWDNQSFHDYADYALSAGFRVGLERLVALGRTARCAMLCSEAVWWRCHRRIVADHLIARGERVLHLMGRDRIEPAVITADARITAEGAVTYPAGPGAGGA
jgi:uncharacterized protein (DUF488 family)